MAKGKRSGPAEAQKRRSRPYKARGKSSEGDSVVEQAGREDWEDAVCPICLESPHNAVLLVCSSHADGCLPYMCNTSDRHSNCLGQYQAAQVGLQKYENSVQMVSESEQQQAVVESSHAGDNLSVRIVDAYPAPPSRRSLRGSINPPEHASNNVEMGNVIIEALNSRAVSAGSSVTTRGQSESVLMPHLSREDTDPSGFQFLDLETGSDMEALEGASSTSTGLPGSPSSSSSSKSKHLVCPLCRGQIFGWRVINSARKYFNGKARNCSHESCLFTGTYQALRVHARCEHPCARPRDVDPLRQRDWVCMERQREIADVLSTINSSTEDMDIDDEHWWSYLLLLHFFGPVHEEGMVSQLQDHQAGSQRASARFRDLMENINRAASARFRELIDPNINTAVDGASSGSMGEQSTHPLQSRQHRHRRGVN